MPESSGDNAIDGTAPSIPEDLAHVLECEFLDLHQGDLSKATHEALDQDRPAVIQAKQQQPLADPSLLSPADRQTYDQRLERPETAKTPSQQPDIDPAATTLRKLWESVHGLAGDGRTALCLSGGGVRSAAFNLGVLQGLARLELLNQFHYLSTVSGGGYIGCWLSAWRHRCEKGISDVTRGLSWPDRIGDAEIPPRVPDAISNLRRDTNYLTPAKGILSPDTWATITVVGRNLILNHLVIVPLIAALLLTVKVFGAAAHDNRLFAGWKEWINSSIGDWLPLSPQHLGSLLLAGVFVALGWIIFSIARPSWDVRRPSPLINTIPPATTPSRESLAQIWAPRLGIVSVLFGAFIFALMAAKDIPQGQTNSFWNWWRFAAFPIGGAIGALVAFVLALAVATVKRALCKFPKTADWAVRFLGYVPALPPGPVTVPTAGAHAVFLLALAAIAAGVAGGLVLGAGEELAVYLPKNNPWSTALVLSIAPLWFVISYNVGDAIFLGLTARRPRLREKLDWSDGWGDEEREWVARTGGYLTVIALGISILCLLTLFGPELIKSVANVSWTGPVGLATVAILSALASIGLAASPFSTHVGTAPKGVRLPVRTILAIATPIFGGLLAAILSTALDLALFKEPLLNLLSVQGDFGLPFDPRKPSGQLRLLGLAFFLALFSFCAAVFVNINRFSLYDLYRMRLTREFLGASNRNRRPDFWTGFDETDDIPLADLWPSQTDSERRLYPVINVTLNMAATKRLEWQERKAVSFVLTPRYCGSGATPDLGFRDTKDYATGVRLGWAMSVSGAAVSPNAGYATMPGLALLMTLFNLRLGAWSGNPGEAGGKSYRLRGPANALRPLLDEALAQTDDQAKYVYLSDGGHFDNLGVYEMLRRRCRFIVISDATCDPDYAYADLGSVVRKAAIDFGIRITFKHLDMARRGETAIKGAYSAFAVIEYPETRSSGRRQRGYLLYIKAFYGGLEEPADVRAYALENPAFPHDKTLNQFFGEAQFESYRALGSFTVMELGRQAGFASTSKAEKPTCLTQFFRGARRGLAKSRAAREL
jgi:Patatin-like phospholipase